MTKVRIYHIPDGYTDVVCNYVDVVPSKKQCIIHGGPDDGKVFENSSGAWAIKETAGIQETLF